MLYYCEKKEERKKKFHNRTSESCGSQLGRDSTMVCKFQSLLINLYKDLSGWLALPKIDFGKDFCEHKSFFILVLYGSSYFWDLKAWKSTLIRGPARVNSDKRHGPNISDSTTKMKSRQETTSLGQIVTVTEKPTISDKHFMNTDTRRFKIQTGDMGAPLAGPLISLFL